MTDNNGQILVGCYPFDNDGTIEHGYGQANGTLIIRVERDGELAYTFLEATKFNIEYWRDHTSLGEHEIYVNLINNPIPVELASFTSQVIENDVTLYWITATESGNFGFEIQRSRDRKDYERIGFIAGNNTTSNPQNYQFVDRNPTAGCYFYRLKKIDLDGSFEYSNIIEANVGVPSSYNLSQNYPNPFNPVTNIDYEIPEGAVVRLEIYNLLGQLIRKLVDRKHIAGYYTVQWDGKNDKDIRVPSGVYIYSMQTENFRAKKKLLFVH